MKRLLCVLIAAVFLSLFPAEASHGQYYSQSRSQGYTYRNGYYWDNYGRAYKRVRRWRRVGCCYRWVTYYEPVEVDPYTDDATKKLLEIAAVRDRYEGRIRMDANRHNMFLEKLKALGLENNFRWNGYGYQLQMPSGAGYGQYAYQPYAQQGNTVYGYSQFATPYGEVDMTLALKQAKDLTQNAQQLAGSGHQHFMEYMQEMADGQSRVAEIMAKTELLKAAEPKDMPKKVQSFTFRAVTNGDGKLKVERVETPAAATPEALYAVLQTRCTGCHGAQKQVGNVDMRNFLQFSRDQQLRVIELITTSDETKRMPKAPDGAGGYKPGKPLHAAEVVAISKHVK